MAEKQFDIRLRTLDFSIALLKFIDTLQYKPLFQPVIKQLLSSGTSIGANVHESKAGSTTKDYVHFLNIALKSSNETQYWFELLEKGMGLKSTGLTELKNESIELSNILASMIIKIKEKQKINSNELKTNDNK